MAGAGTFCWYALMVPDVAAAERFYSDVFGWRLEDADIAGVDYHLFRQGERAIGGLMPTMEGGPAPMWTGYVQVDDCRATADRAATLGATLHRPPTDIPGTGRFAILSDAQGALIGMIEQVPPAPGMPEHLTADWHELHASDREAALSFHTALWGWQKGRTLDMGSNGIYQMFARQGTEFGAVFTNRHAAPHWLFYFHVDGLNTAVQRVEQGGGTVDVGPHEIPGGRWMAHCTDLQGARFAMVSEER